VTAPAQDDTKLTAAKAFFIGFFALALGWAGVLVAAIAVATEETWSNGRVEGDRNRERRAGWLDTQRSWLGADHRRRTEQNRARRDWLNNGADPKYEPETPSAWPRFGAAVRRTFANVVLAAVDFTHSFRDAWARAQQTRKAGGSFGDVWSGRHGPDEDYDEDGQPLPGRPADESTQGDPQPTQPTSGDADHSQPDDQPSAPDPARNEPDDTAAPDTLPEDATNPAQPNTEGEPMTSPIESNATVLAAKLTAVTTTVSEVSTDVDTLGAVTTELRDKVTRAADLAHSAGMPTEAVVAVDAIQHAAGVIDGRLEDFSTAAAEATDRLTAAADGLRPVVQTEDKLHAAGADGRVFDNAAA
jgi:hypothetical protein